MIKIATLLKRLNLVDGETVIGEFNVMIPKREYCIVTNKRVVLATANRIGTEWDYRSIPLRGIVSVDLAVNKGILGDVFINTISGQVECHIHDVETATKVYNTLMKLLI